MKSIACVILPVFNEAANVCIVIPQIFEQAGKIKTHELHVLVVDDNSPDGTGELVRELTQTHPHLHLLTGVKKGLGDAYKRGMAYALAELKPDLVFQMDADLQHDASLLPKFVSLCNGGFNLVIGSRFGPGSSTPNFPWRRRMLSLLATRLVCWFGGLPPLTDCTSGFRCIKRELLAKCDLESYSTRGYAFQSSLLCELVKNGARVAEIPIVFAERKQGASKLSLRDQAEFLLNLLNLRLRRPTKRSS
jgi:dolichol-phosphate mannosyltransferase